MAHISKRKAQSHHRAKTCRIVASRDLKYSHLAWQILNRMLYNSPLTTLGRHSVRQPRGPLADRRFCWKLAYWHLALQRRLFKIAPAQFVGFQPPVCCERPHGRRPCEASFPLKPDCFRCLHVGRDFFGNSRPSHLALNSLTPLSENSRNQLPPDRDSPLCVVCLVEWPETRKIDPGSGGFFGPCRTLRRFQRRKP